MKFQKYQFHRILKLGIIGLLSFPILLGCGRLTAVFASGEGEFSFEVQKKKWDYAARVMPLELISQVRQENLDERWSGDPKRFQAVKVRQFGQKLPLYFIDPYIPCPEGGCPTRELYDQYHPACNVSGGCAKLVYLEQENGKYRRVFKEQFYQQATVEEGFLKVSPQLEGGYPACFEMTGFDLDMKLQGLSDLRDDQVFVSRYCYNGTDYVFQNLYVVQRPGQ